MCDRGQFFYELGSTFRPPSDDLAREHQDGLSH
jgi:hypothetical protein